MYDLKDFKAADHIPALLDWMRAQMKGCGGKTAVVGISGGKDSSVIAALCVEAYGRENVVGVLMPDGVQPDIDYSNGIVDFLGKPPSDGLTGKTDEDNLGFSYHAVNEYVRKGVADPAIKEQIDHKHRVSRFKFQTIPVYHNGLPIVIEDGTDFYK